MDLIDLYSQKMQEKQNEDQDLESRLALGQLKSNLIPNIQPQKNEIAQVKDIYSFPKLQASMRMAPMKKEEEDQSGL